MEAYAVMFGYLETLKYPELPKALNSGILHALHANKVPHGLLKALGIGMNDESIGSQEGGPQQHTLKAAPHAPNSSY